ncbi:MAG: 50S ribosomal protein L10 [Anaerolineales bacterium]
MAITKKRKGELLAHYQELVRGSRGMVLTSFAGLSVKELEGLRRKIRDLGGDFHVVKNSLIRLAFREAGLPEPEGARTGTTAVGFGSEDLPSIAKAILDVARDRGAIELKGAWIEGTVYSARQVQQLAELPPLPVVRARLLGVLQAPAGKLAGVLAGSVRQVVQVVKAYSQKEAGVAAA